MTSWAGIWTAFDGQTKGLVLVVVALFFLLLAGMLRRALSVRRAARGLAERARRGAETTAAPPNKDPDAILWSHFQRCVVQREDTSDGSRYVVSSPVGAALHEAVETWLSRSRAFAMGSSLTGVALIFTFGLISWVLVTDVSKAIGALAEAATSASANKDLSSAVQRMGAKFAISAAGVLLSIAHTLLARSLRRFAHTGLREAEAALAVLCVNIDQHRLRTAEAAEQAAGERNEKLATILESNGASLHEVLSTSNDLHRATLAILQDEAEASAKRFGGLTQQLGTLDSSVRKLSSIEVSIQAIGTDVATNIGKMMRQSMAEELKGILAEMMANLEEMAKQFQGELAQTILNEMMQVREALAGVRRSIESQGESQLEAILRQLQDVLSGGFQSESANMTTVLRQFAEVVPELSKQIQTMTGQMTEEMGRKAEESRRISDALLGRMSELVERLESQQSASHAAIERMTAASSEGAALASERIARSGQEVVDRLLKASGEEIGQILTRFREMSEVSALQTGDLAGQMAKIVESVTVARDALERSAGGLSQMATRLHDVLAGGQKDAEATRAALTQFTEAGRVFATTTQGARQLVEELGQRIQAQQSLVEQERAHAQRVEEVWPKLFDTYLQEFKRQSEALASAWQSQADKVDALVRGASASLASNVGELSDSVDRLARLQSQTAPPKGPVRT